MNWMIALHSCHDRTFAVLAAWVFTVLYAVLAGLKWQMDPKGDRYCSDPNGSP